VREIQRDISEPGRTVPRKKRKLKISHIFLLLFLVAAVAFTLFRLNLKKKLRARIEAIHTAGYPVTNEELDKWYSIPDDVDNAAYIILDAFDYYREPRDRKLLPVVGEAELPARTEPLPEEMGDLIAKYLSDNKQALELLHEASILEHGRYPIDLSIYSEISFSHLADIRRCAFLLELEAIYSAENNEQDMAVKSLKSIFGVARSLANEPMAVSQLVRIACQGLAVSSLEHVVNRTYLNDEQLAELYQVITGSQIQSISGMSRAFAGERCVFITVFVQRTSENFNTTSRVHNTPIIQLYKAVGLCDIDTMIYLDTIDEYVEVLKLPPYQQQKATNHIDSKIRGISKIHILLYNSIPAFSRIITINIRNIAGLRTAQAALAIQRYRLAKGELPDQLNDLVPNYLDAVPADPFDGKELRYRKLDRGFVVYSIGEDLRDDGGVEMPRNAKDRQSIRNWDITFIVEK
jgi:hypothetical protein